VSRPRKLTVVEARTKKDVPGPSNGGRGAGGGEGGEGLSLWIGVVIGVRGGHV